MPGTAISTRQIDSVGFPTTFRNRLINGEMMIDQVNGGNSLTVNDNSTFRSVDQIEGIGQLTDGVFTLQRQSATPPANFSNYLRATCTTADVSIGAGQRYILLNRIEGYNVRDFGFGTASPKTVTLSFWVRSSLTGTYCGSFVNNTSNRSYPFEYVINVANTWEQKSITLVGDTTGTWEKTNLIGIRLFWSLAIGATYQGTLNTWTGAEYYGTSNQVNFMSSNTSRTWDITGIQLEAGTVATPFEVRPFPLEVQLCQRYYEKSYALDTVPGTNTATNLARLAPIYVVANEVDVMINYKVPKRAIPTNIFTYTAAGVSGQWGWWSNTTATRTDHPTGANPIGENTAILFQTAVLTDRNGGDGHWVADARL